jgi:hypothetical protein
MKTTRNKPATFSFGRRFLNVTAALGAVFLLGTTALAGPNEMWAATIGITGGSITPAPRVLAIDSSGSSYVVGYGDTGPGTPAQAYIVKLDSSGAFLWLTSLSSGTTGSLAQFTDGVIDNAGDLVATGFIDDPAAPSIWLNVKLDPATGAGSANWPDLGNGVGVRVIATPGVDLRGSRIEPALIPGVVISGASNSQMLMALYDASGNLSASWPDVGNGQGIRAYAPAGGVVDITAPVLVKRDTVFPTGNYNLAGTGVFNTTNLDYICVKFTPGGTLLWDSKYSPNSFGVDRVSDLAVDGNGHCFLTGESEDVANSRFEMATVRFNNGAGGIGWSARTSNTAAGRKLAIISGGATFVAGFQGSTNTMIVWKYNSTGALATGSWVAAGGQPAGARRLGGIPGDQAEDIWINGTSLYVTGKVWDAGIQKMTTWKLNSSNGATNWIERFGIAGTENSGVAMKVGGFSTAIATGFTRPAGGGPASLVVIRYVP